VSLTLVIHHAIRMRHIVICGLSGSTEFFQIISHIARFSRKKVIEHKMRVLIFYTTFVRNNSHSKKICYHKCRL